MRKALRTLVRRHTLFAVVLALALLGATQGFAATLGSGSDTLGAGNAAVASCQTGGAPTSTYNAAYEPAVAAYVVTTVHVTNLDAACAGKLISLTLTGSGGGSLGTLTGTVPAGGGSLALTPGAAVVAAGVTGVSVAIAG